MIFACLSALINIVLGFVLFFKLGFYGLALATTIASWANVACLAITQSRHGHFIVEASVPLRLFKMMIASIVMGAAVFYFAQWGQGLTTGKLIWDYSILLLVCGLGLLVYAFANIIMRTFNYADMKQAFKKS